MSFNPYVEIIKEHADTVFRKNIEKIPQWEEIFPQKQPLVLDIGCGSGNFLRDLAIRRPEQNYVGIELKYKRLVKASDKFKKHGLPNIKLLQKRAEEIDTWFPPHSVQSIFVNFPDPWPKKRHHKNRLLQPVYFEKIFNILKKTGTFYFKTDHENYFTEVVKTIEASPHFQITQCTKNLKESRYIEENITTEFESIFSLKGMPIYYLQALGIF